MRVTSIRRLLACGLAAAATLLLVSGTGTGAATARSAWPTGGYDLSSNRYNPAERTIGPGNAAQLHERWAFTTGGDVPNTPSVDESRVYLTDMAGNVLALDRETGAQVWNVKVSDVTGIAGDYSRNTPAIAGRLLILGDQGGSAGAGGNHFTRGSGGAWVFALGRATGALVEDQGRRALPRADHPESAGARPRRALLGVRGS